MHITAIATPRNEAEKKCWKSTTSFVRGYHIPVLREETDVIVVEHDDPQQLEDCVVQAAAWLMSAMAPLP